ncbi:uncharacterized protein ColSpa_11022 [Colletotrichum spaethianum]|uniref:Uncharacterized protein n=1 Tax=Colletotrichum spaethianum TaxID=700344 RepID=A0AA37PEJ1_9PEZI|nr:uncharacterized protein ColSpa_11022 [Colletotrichum spaethianum]GKT50841.1 hypothetical protein ColSpa_11022 [Colletotrichum spaethianum]
MSRAGLFPSDYSDHGAPKRIIIAFLKSRQVRLFGLFAALLIGIRVFILDSSSGGVPQDYAATNPWRDLPPSTAVHGTIGEVLLIGDTLRDGMLPTSLPDDDYDMYSAMLRSLETRSDLTWLVVQETGIDKTVMAIANRGGYHSPIPEEPHDLHERAKRLHRHWFTLASAKDKPDRWEARFDTTSLPPLVSGRATGSGQNTDPTTMDLTVEQKEAADTKYRAYRQRRDRAVSYLKDHPPKPMAWSPIQTEPESTRGAWETIFSDGIVQAGRKVVASKLAKNPMFKPIYRDLLTERVPYDWVNPNEPVKEYTEQDHLKDMEAFREGSRTRQERTDRQAKFQEELRGLERLERGARRNFDETGQTSLESRGYL